MILKLLVAASQVLNFLSYHYVGHDLTADFIEIPKDHVQSGGISINFIFLQTINSILIWKTERRAFDHNFSNFSSRVTITFFMVRQRILIKFYSGVSDNEF